MKKKILHDEVISKGIKKEFVGLIKDVLEKEQISLRELARRCGLDVSFLSKILTGKRNPPSNEKDIRRIAKALRVNPERMLFAAGRIPANLQYIFNNEEFIESLTSGNPKTYQKTIEINAGFKVTDKRVSEIEDELL